MLKPLMYTFCILALGCAIVFFTDFGTTDVGFVYASIALGVLVAKVG